MTAAVAGIDPHQGQFTIAVVDSNGAELGHATFANTGAGYAEAIDSLTGHAVGLVGIEGSASWGAHVSVALVAAGFDAREVPTGRSAAQRRARRQAKNDTIDAYSAARALLADPDLGPAQALEISDPLLAELEAVLEHRRMLVELRTLRLHHVQAQLSKLPTDVRDQLPTTGKVESRLRALQSLDRLAKVSTSAGAYRLSWLAASCSRPGRPVRDPPPGTPHRHPPRRARHHPARRTRHRPHRRSHPAGRGRRPTPIRHRSPLRPLCGTGAVPISSGDGDNQPVRHRLDLRGNRRVNSMLHIASVTQQRDHQPAQDYLQRKRTSGKTRREARRAHKRHLTNRVIRRMWNDETNRLDATTRLAA